MGSTDLLEIDTKGMCLLCLNPCPNTSFNYSTCVQGFKKLLRYLNVNTTQLFNCSVQFLQSMEISEDIEVGISLCFSCALVTQKFEELYKQYEVIRLQFDGCVQSVEQSIRNGDENPTRVREYKERMKPQRLNDLFNASFAANLRSETLKKCSSKLVSSPRVSIPKVEKSPSKPSNVTANLPSNPIVSVPSIPIINIPSTSTVNTSSAPTLNFPPSLSVISLPLASTSTSIPCQSLSVPAVTSNRDNGDSAIAERIGSKSPSTDALVSNKDDDSDDSSEIEVLSITPVKKPAGVGDNDNYQSADADDTDTSRSSRPELVPCSECSTSILRSGLRSHQLTQHPELFLREHFPPDVTCTPSLCRSALGLLLSQLETTDSGLKCPYCASFIKSRAKMKTHVINFHTITFAQEMVVYTRERREPPDGTPPPPEDGGREHLDESCDMDLEGYPIEIELNDPLATDPEPGPSTSAYPPPVADNTLSCVLCNSKFSSRALLDEHMELQSCEFFRPKDAKCDICGKTYPSRAQLNKHLKTHTDKSYSCSYCEHFTNSSYSLKYHMFGLHLIPIIMKEIPGKGEEEMGAVVDEVMEEIKLGENQCPYCDTKTVSLVGLKRHLFVAHFGDFVQKVRNLLEGRQGKRGGK